MMLKLSLSILFVVACVQAQLEDGDSRIIKGNPAQNGKIPYMASVQVTGQGHMCGGAILDSKWILTSGHCIARIMPDTKKLKVVVGTTSLKAGGQEFDVSKVTVHPDFDKSKLINDIALLQVSKPMEFGDKVQAIDLPEKDTETGANVMVSGWGLTANEQSAYPDKLQTLNRIALSIENCKDVLGDFPNEKRLCTVPQKKGTGICVRDAGSPLVEGKALVGVASFVLFDCGSKYPDGYASVFAYKDWIKKNMS
ncbi:chymotrypsin-2-like [Pieris rapae]|uniref:chymotrypsin-2-like n=1 Tax=Pieris rapae TaxID=64459 RepID=UPI001E27F328|nr:chymotrypsin-2-like [Pieris rapae]